MQTVTYQLRDNIGIIRVNNPPVNALSHSVRNGLTQCLEMAQSDASEAIIIFCEGRTFIAGADISEFGKPPQKPSLPEVMSALENFNKLVIAAVHGTALGGGFEATLVCHYRCAVQSAKIGLPEVKLGLLPGSGGTQRTPRLCGIEAALDLMTTGTPISATKAFKLGIIDKLIDHDNLLEGAIDYAKELIADKAPLKRVRDIPLEKKSTTVDLLESYRTKLAKKMRKQEAPQHIVSAVEAALNLSFDEGMIEERRLFIECRNSDQSAALRHMFFAERQSPKIKNFPKDATTREIKSVAIIGGGLMGGGIAMNFASAGFPVKILEINQANLEKCLTTVYKNYDASAKKGRISGEQADKTKALISGTTSYDDLGEVDLVIEAVFESMDVKKQVFTKLDEVCKAGTILATNTSYLDVNEIAHITKRPEDVIGLHFFSPAHIMKLLEIVRADKTADDVIATSMRLAQKIKKVPALSNVCYGFIGNRMLRQYLREVQMCIFEGANPDQIDRVMMDWGMAMGPLMVADMAGLDISYKARQVLTDEEKGDPKSYRIADVLVEMGRLGQKTNLGYYKYDPETRERSADPEVIHIINDEAKIMGISRKKISDEEILSRLTLAWINEGFKILDEGIAQRPSDIDVVYCFGYGFPIYRGGPMFFADTIGLSKVYEDICKYRQSHGDMYWTPSPLLKRLVNEEKSLTDWAKEGS